MAKEDQLSKNKAIFYYTLGISMAIAGYFNFQILIMDWVILTTIAIFKTLTSVL